MYATASQIDTYRTIHNSTLSSGRDIEASALTKAALLLKNCQCNWEADDRETRSRQAVKTTQMLWSIFQSELANPDNPLPKNIREDILNLSLFIDKRLFEFLASPAPEKLDIIVKINLSVAAGLRNVPKQSALDEEEPQMPYDPKREVSKSSVRPLSRVL